jgi:hypothetical protein
MAGETKVVKGEILPYDSHELRMPAGTPLGLGILGAARFSAIRRVLDHAARAAQAKASLHHAEAVVARALVAREVAREQLRNLDTILEDEADRITTGVRIAKLRRRLELIEAEDQVAEAEARREKKRGTTSAARQASPGAVEDEFGALLRDLQKVPGLAKAIGAVKEQIVQDAGGEEKLSEGLQQACGMLDGLLLSILSKRAGETAF